MPQAEINDPVFKKPLSGPEQRAIQKTAMHLKAGFPVSDVILFGSKVRGDADEESDLDLLVLTSREISWAERKRIHEPIFKIELAYDVIISILLVTENDWHQGYFSVLPIYEEVEKDGLSI